MLRYAVAVALVAAACVQPAAESKQLQTFTREVEAREARATVARAEVADLASLVEQIEGLALSEDQKRRSTLAVSLRAGRLADAVAENLAALETTAVRLEDTMASIADDRGSLDREMFQTPGFTEAVSAYVDAASRRACAEAVRDGFDAKVGAPVDVDALALAVGDELLDLGATRVDAPGVDCSGWWLEDTAYWTRSEILGTLCSRIDVGRVADLPKDYVGSCMRGFGRVDSVDAADCAIEAYVDDRNTSSWRYRLRVRITAGEDDCAWLTGKRTGAEFEWWAVHGGVELVDQYTGYLELIDLRIFRP